VVIAVQWFGAVETNRRDRIERVRGGGPPGRRLLERASERAAASNLRIAAVGDDQRPIDSL
jgi:hypothetical protein